MTGKRLRILAWHIHGSYLNTLARIDHEWILPVKAGRPEGYGGRGATFDLPDNVREVVASGVREKPTNGSQGYVTHVQLKRATVRPWPSSEAQLWHSYSREDIPGLERRPNSLSDRFSPI